MEKERERKELVSNVGVFIVGVSIFYYSNIVFTRFGIINLNLRLLHCGWKSNCCKVTLKRNTVKSKWHFVWQTMQSEQNKWVVLMCFAHSTASNRSHFRIYVAAAPFRAERVEINCSVTKNLGWEKNITHTHSLDQLTSFSHRVVFSCRPYA